MMEHVKDFLDTTTIHGFSWISRAKRFSRYFWILVVFGGFSGAVYLIYTSFLNWEQSPISTTIETKPISAITFPNVTVCPPKNSFLNLNYDLMKAENLKIDENVRKELFNYTVEVIQEEFYEEIMKNLSKVNEENRYYNWYHGLTKLECPYHHEEYNRFNYMVHTYATSGNITTENFGTRFKAEEVESNIYVNIYNYVPEDVRYNETFTYLYNIDKITMVDFGDNDKMTVGCYDCKIDSDATNFSKNFTGPSSSYETELVRRVPKEAIKKTGLHMMPGFRLTWNYNPHVENWSKYDNKYFMR